MDGHSSHSPWLNYGCKIECLQWNFLNIKKCHVELNILNVEFYFKKNLSGNQNYECKVPLKVNFKKAKKKNKQTQALTG